MDHKTREQMTTEMAELIMQMNESDRDEFMDILRKCSEKSQNPEIQFDLLGVIQESNVWKKLSDEKQAYLVSRWEELKSAE